MFVVSKTRDHVPVQMWHLVAERGEIHFVRVQQLAQRRLDRKHRLHKMQAFSCRQVGHFLYMPVENHPAETRIIRVARQDYTQRGVLPQDVFILCPAQGTGVFGHGFIPIVVS